MHPAYPSWVYLVLVATLTLTGTAPSAQGTSHIHHIIELAPGKTPHHEGDQDELRPVTARDAEHYAWNFTSDADQTIIELRIANGTLDIERPEQIVPTFSLPEDRFPFFAEWPDPAVWQAEDTDRIYNRSIEEDRVVLRLRLPGPAEGRLAIGADTTPPTILDGGATDVNATGFTYQVRTDEPTRLEMGVRTGPDWNRTSSSDLNADHVVRIDRLRPETVYAVHIITRDWAGNMGQHDDHVTTRANTSELHIEPVRPTGTVGADAEIVIEVRIRNMTAPLVEARATLDGDPVQAPREEDDRLVFHPAVPPGTGAHIVQVEVADADGEDAEAVWTFSVADTNATGRPLVVPGAPTFVGVLLLAGLVVMARRQVVH